MNIWNNFSSCSVFWLYDSLASSSEFWFSIIDEFSNSRNCSRYMNPNYFKLVFFLLFSLLLWIEEWLSEGLQDCRRSTRWNKRWDKQNESFLVVPMKSNLEVRNINLEVRNINLEVRNINLEVRNINLEVRNINLEVYPMILLVETRSDQLPSWILSEQPLKLSFCLSHLLFHLVLLL